MAKELVIPYHVAIIADGNGRWAKRRKLPRSTGHYFGGMNIAKIVSYANDLNVKEMTVFTFSTENWNRPKDEVDYLMSAPLDIVKKHIDKITTSNIKIKFVGRRTKISNDLIALINELELKTKNNSGLLLNVAFDYGAYDEIINAITLMKDKTIEEFEKNLMVKTPVDLLIRTSGETRISNFLLWQISYAEIYFTKKHWPAFSKRDFLKAIKIYNKKDRRFGKIKEKEKEK